MYNDSSFQYFGNKQVMWKYTLFFQHYQPSKITLQISVLIIEYLFATSHELCMMEHVLYFVVLMTVAAEIIIEKSGICVW